MALDPQLLDILACPDIHHAPLDYDEPGQTLTCTECARVFPIRDGIPVLLLDEATNGPSSGDARGAAEGKRSTSGDARGAAEGKRSTSGDARGAAEGKRSTGADEPAAGTPS